MTSQHEKWAVVTGGSIRGGLAITHALHRRGFSIVVHHSSADSLPRAQAVVNELNKIRPNTARRWQAALEDHPAFPYDDLEVEKVVCNASQLTMTDCADFEKGLLDFRIHVTGHAALLSSVEERLRRNHGSVVGVTDIQTAQPNKDFVWYHVAKSGLETLMRALAVQWAPEVRFNVVAPGPMDWHEGWNDEERRQTILSGTPLQRIGSFDELASTVAWLACDATYITGQVIKMDGGRSVWLK
ncbi:MAG TPA: SDR family oxidoreductase [Burkholderiales bacterium]|nr:SDR family oxidoreductase [Burkholderiales bacterium]